VGTIITADSIGFKAWPKEMVQDAYFLEGEADMQKMLGTVVRNPITAGEPITQGSLVAPAIAASSPPRSGRACAPSPFRFPPAPAWPASCFPATISTWC
jgi:Flp pilus assembly protein CpaB